jgi:hypothetical protein
LTIFAASRIGFARLALAKAPVMTRRTARAGGCFLSLLILCGFVAGLAIGNPMKGVLIGTAIGVLAAALLWLIDRRA